MTQFETYTQNSYKKVRYYIDIEGVSDIYSYGDISGLTTKKYISGLSTITRKIEVNKGRSSIGAVKIDIVDKNQELTALIFNDINLKDKQVVVWAGYAEIDVNDYQEIFTGYIDDINLNSKMTGYIFEVKDITDKFKTKKALNCFDDPSWNNGINSYDLDSDGIDDFFVERKEITTGTGQNQEIVRYVVIRGNPMIIPLVLMMDTADGANGDYDLGEGIGVGIDPSLVDITEFKRLSEDYFGFDVFRFEEKEPVELKKILEEEIYKVNFCYPIVTGAGIHTVKVLEPLRPGATPTKPILEKEVMPNPAHNSGIKNIINVIEFEFDYDIQDNQYKTKNIYYNDDSISEFGEMKPLKIKSKCIHSDLDGYDIAAFRAKKIFRRFEGPVPEVKVQTFFSKRLIGEGDTVELTHKHLPKYDSSVRGLDADLFEVTERQVDEIRGKLNLKLLGRSKEINRYGIIAPSGLITGLKNGKEDRDFYIVPERISAFQIGFGIQITSDKFILKGTSIITNIDTDTNKITIDPPIPLGNTIVPGEDYLRFDEYDKCVPEQTAEYCFIGDLNNLLPINEKGFVISEG